MDLDLPNRCGVPGSNTQAGRHAGQRPEQYRLPECIEIGVKRRLNQEGGQSRPNPPQPRGCIGRLIDRIRFGLGLDRSQKEHEEGP